MTKYCTEGRALCEEEGTHFGKIGVWRALYRSLMSSKKNSASFEPPANKRSLLSTLILRNAKQKFRRQSVTRALRT